MRMKTFPSLKQLTHSARLLALAAATLMASHSAMALDGTWTNLAGGLWDLTTNWSGGIVADGSGFTANFNTLNITATTTVNLNSPHTIGNLTFADTTTSTAGSWILANNGSSLNVLTLAGSSPTVSVAGLGTGATVTISAEIAGTSGLLKNGAGTLVLSGANTYTGTTAISGGNLILSGSLTTSGLLSLTNAATFTYAPSVSGSHTLGGTSVNFGNATITNITSGNTLNLGAITRNTGGALNISSVVGTTTTSNTVANGILGTWVTTGTGTGLTYANGGSGGAITAYTGTAAATAANVTDTTGAVNYDVAAVGALGGGASFNTLRYTGATGTITGAFSANSLMNVGAGAVTYSGAVTIGADKELIIWENNSGSTTISGVISDSGGGASKLIKAGLGAIASASQNVSSPLAGMLTLSNANSYTGGTWISSGALNITNRFALGTGAVNIASGGQLWLQYNSTTNAFSNDVILNGGAAAIFFRSAGLMSGNITLNADSGIANANAGGNYTGTISGNIDLQSYRLSVSSSGVNNGKIFSGVITGNSSSSVSANGGPTTISGDNGATYAGTTFLVGGNLLIGHANALGIGAISFSPGNNQTVTFSGIGSTARTFANRVFMPVGGNTGNSATYAFGGTGDLTFTDATAIDLSTAIRTFQINNVNTRFDAEFSGTTGGITKTGTGTLILNGANSYVGATTVNAGTLLVNGSLAAGSAVTVGASGTLGGTGGTINGATVVNGSLNPGSSPGVLTFGSTLSLAGTANFELNGISRGTQYDGVNVTGSLTNGGVLSLNFGSAFLTGGETFDLFNLSGGESGSFSAVNLIGAYTGSLSNTSGVWTGTVSGLDFTYTQATGDLGVVPEPSTWALLAFSLTTVILFRRRRA